MIIENAYHGSGFGVTCKPNGRVDQLEDRYLGMVEAPSSNLGTSTTFDEMVIFLLSNLVVRKAHNSYVKPNPRQQAILHQSKVHVLQHYPREHQGRLRKLFYA